VLFAKTIAIFDNPWSGQQNEFCREPKMRTNMKLTVLAIAVALSLPASMSIAQEANVDEMMSGLNMLETNAAMAFAKYGIDADPMDLTVGQLSLIARALSDPDGDTGGESKKRTIKFIAGM
jgi:hypothetical protein